MESSPKKEHYPLLLVEDDETLAIAVTDALEPQGYKVFRAVKCKDALKILAVRSINVALVDRKLPDGEGTAILEYIIKNQLKTKMILMTAYGPDRWIKEYVEKGTFDFLEKPLSLEKLLKRIENANKMFQLEHSQEALEFYHKPAYKIIGNNPEMTKIKKMISLVAKSDSPVLIQGETGTGKELIARNIHLESDRRNNQFISVNCPSIPDNLFESEFFGFEKGAFTGAYKGKPGYFEMANYGILHLDEIGDMPEEFQAKLLRVLEEGSYIKLGGTKEIQVDVRIIASTNKRLKDEVAAKRFREDLYFRIAVFNIDLPPLRERIDDIPLIAEYLWNDLTLKMGRKLLTPAFSFEDLKKFPWKGNVRELRNHLEKKLIYLNMGEDYEPESKTFTADKKNDNKLIPLDDYVKAYVLNALEYCGYNKAETARTLDISLSTLKRKLLRWGLQIKKEIGSNGD